jgi:hypothetical protein
MFTFLFKAVYWDDCDSTECTRYHVLRAESFVDAVSELENFYGKELLHFEVHALEDFFGEISESEYNRMLQEDY